MKTAGKAFIIGLFGTLGVATAILGTGAVVGRIGESYIRKAVRDFERAREES